jgi:uncharacterized protein
MRAFDVAKVVGFYGALLVVALVALALRGSLGTLVPADGLAWVVALGLGAFAGLAVVGASRLLVNNMAWAENLADEFRSIFGELDRRRALLMAVASGLGEEALFRGVLQPSLGLWLGALVFGLLHIGPNARFVPWTVMACAAGLLFGLLFERTGSLVAPMVAHATINYLNLRYIAAPQRTIELHLEPVGGEGAVGGS